MTQYAFRRISTPSQNPEGFQFLKEGSVQNAATFTVSSIPYRKKLWIYLTTNGHALADTIGCRFNADVGNNYNYKTEQDGAASVSAVTQSKLLVNQHSSTMPYYMRMDLINQSWGGPTRLANWTGYEASANVGTAGYHIQGGGQWFGGNPISSVTFYTVGANNFNDWVTAQVYGAN